MEEPYLKSAVLIPTYNESENIEDLIITIKRLDPSFLILVIDDSSPDGTSEIVKKLQKKFKNIMLIVRPGKMGLGTAIRDGFKFLSSLANRPDHVIVMDADFSHNPNDIPRFLKYAEKGYDIIVGSRYIRGGEIKGWPSSRIIISKIANKIAKTFIRLPVNDFTSGFRCYSMKYILKTAPNLKSQRFEIQIETLKQAQRLKMKVTEIPITFINRKKGKSKLTVREIINFLFYVFRSLF